MRREGALLAWQDVVEISVIIVYDWWYSHVALASCIENERRYMAVQGGKPGSQRREQEKNIGRRSSFSPNRPQKRKQRGTKLPTTHLSTSSIRTCIPPQGASKISPKRQGQRVQKSVVKHNAYLHRGPLKPVSESQRSYHMSAQQPSLRPSFEAKRQR